jgi:hypothetical protein
MRNGAATLFKPGHGACFGWAHAFQAALLKLRPSFL